MKNFFISYRRRIILILFDIVCIALVTALYSFFSRFAAYSTPMEEYGSFACLVNFTLFAAFTLAIRFAFRLYANIWRYTNSQAYLILIVSDVVASLLTYVTVRVFWIEQYFTGFWSYVTVASMNIVLTLASRFVYRQLYKFSHKQVEERDKVPIAIIGAGTMGVCLLNDMRSRPDCTRDPLFFIDSDPAKVNGYLLGLTVYKEDEKVLDLIREKGIRELCVAISHLDQDKATLIYNFYASTGCKLKIYDSMVRDVNDPSKPLKTTVRDFAIEDLLLRAPISLEDPRALEAYRGKTVMVTGGGGSIGSEICRQLVACGVARLIVLDIYENNIYDVQQELRQEPNGCELFFEIASVRDRKRLESVFDHYRPQIVFHAAAHKHVPLMEESSAEAVKNNVLGTYNAADMAEKFGVEKFILISTDKAVNPTNVMGATKRVCEMIVQCRTDSKTVFSAVRFGNVLGSNGSVIPLFKRQIAMGGPVTVTDKRIIRYFMTIPEASQLVMLAGAMAKNGELFVLDMGKPVRIYDLAVNMIRLCGLRPDLDIPIIETGLRPGEKLYEELLIRSETTEVTDNHMIFIEHDTPYSRDEVDTKLQILSDAVDESERTFSPSVIRDAIARVVPTFCDPEKLNKSAESSMEMQSVTR